MLGEWAVPGYRPVRTLGTGRSGKVVLAVHEPTRTPVAIKYLAGDLLHDEAFMVRLRQDAARLTEIEEPGAVRLYEFVEHAAGPAAAPEAAALVTELVDGASLTQLLASNGPFGPEAAVLVLRSVLATLAAAHRGGVLHRDVKPANVLVDGEGTVRLTDFGMAVREKEHVPAGTPAYLAPEVWDGRAATAPTDIYAATAVLYECLTGERPYPALNLAQLVQAHRSAPLPVRGVPEALLPLVTQGMAKDPFRRTRDAETALELLDAIALAEYGTGWRERGRAELATRAAFLDLLFPLARGTEAGPAAPGSRTARRSARAAQAARPGSAGRSGRQGLAGSAAPPAAGKPGGKASGKPGGKAAGKPGGKPGGKAAGKPGGKGGGPARGAVLLTAAGVTALLLGGTGAVVLTTGGHSSASDRIEAAPVPSDDATVTTPGDRGGAAPPATNRGTVSPSPKTTPTPSPSPSRTALPDARAHRPPQPPHGGTTPSGSSLAVTGLSVSWARGSGSDTASGTVTVTANGTGPVTLSITYLENGRQADSETYTLSGETSYSRSISYRPGDGCVPLSVNVSTQPVSSNGTQSASTGRNPRCWWL